MADNEQTWDEEPAEEEHDEEEEEQETPKPDEAQQSMPDAQQQLPQHDLQQQVPAPLHLHLQALHGHPGLSPADFAALQQQHNALLLQAQQAQQDFESGQRDKGPGMQMAPAEALVMHQMGQTGMEPPQLQHQHDADYERERKEKRKVANREAARRMRQRRAAQVSTLSVSNTDLKSENSGLQQQMAHLANHNRELMTENAALRQEVLNLKQTLENSRTAGHAANGGLQEGSQE